MNRRSQLGTAVAVAFLLLMMHAIMEPEVSASYEKKEAIMHPLSRFTHVSTTAPTPPLSNLVWEGPPLPPHLMPP
ncbi:membrane-associated protein, putative, partial [Bodo saltans]